MKIAQVYDPRTKTTQIVNINIPTQRQSLECLSQNYVTSGERIIIVYRSEIIVFNMDTETGESFPVNYIDAGDDSGSTGDTDKQEFAVASDNDENLFVVTKNKLYVLDLYTFTKKVSGPTLLKSVRQYHSIGYLNGAVYVVGGFSGTTTIDYSPGCEKVTIDLTTPANMAFAAIGTYSQYIIAPRVLTIGGYLYAITGSNDYSNGWVGSKTVRLLNEGNGSWQKNKGTTKNSRVYATALLRLGKIYLFSGFSTTPLDGATDAQYASACVLTNEKSTVSTLGVCSNDFRDYTGLDVRRRLQVIPGPPGGGAAPDPHFRSIWNNPFDFHGDGCYWYAKTCQDSLFNMPFTLRAQQYKCNAVARCVRNMYIELFDTTNNNKVKEIDVLNDVPFDGNVAGVGTLLITKWSPRQRIIRLTTPFSTANNCGYDFNILLTKTALGLSFKYGGPKCYKCEHCGILGYYGESRNYQYIMGDELGTLKGSRNFKQYGYSWRFGDTCFLPQTRPNKGENDNLIPSVCETDTALKAQIEAECKTIEAEFAACCAEIPEECAAVLKDCAFDACAIKTESPNKSVTEAAREVGVDNLAVACQVKDGIPDPKDLPTGSPTISPTLVTPAPVVTVPASESPTSVTPAPVASTPASESPTKGTPSPTPNTPSPVVAKPATDSPTKLTPAPTTATPAPTTTGPVNPNIIQCDNPKRAVTRRLIFGATIPPPVVSSSSGDPHLKSFYGTFFNYQGKGCYYYQRLCPGKQDGLLPFAIRVQHRRCNSVARCIENVYIDLIKPDGSIQDTIDCKTDYIKDVNQVIAIPNVGSLKVSALKSNGRSFELISPFATTNNCGFDFKITVRSYKYNGGTFLNYYSTPSSCYLCEICGITGYINKDGKPKQWLTRNGEIATRINDFAKTWWYADECVCKEEWDPNFPPVIPEPPPSICDTNDDIKRQVDTKCENAVNNDAGLKDCCDANPDDCTFEKDNCKKDVCAHLTDNINTPVDEAVELMTNINLKDFCIDPPNTVPTASPVKSPTKSPIIQPSKSPVSAPTKSPVKSPTTSPVKKPPGEPSASPVLPPTKSPIPAPTTSPVIAPTKSPSIRPPAPEEVPIDCESVFGSEVITTSSHTIMTSTAKCQAGYTLVSCGFFGSIHSPAGSRIVNGDTCEATVIFERKVDRIQAVARCCQFPPDSNIDIIKRNGGSSSDSVTQCVDPEVLIGCGSSSSDNNVAGTFLGVGTSPQTSNTLVSTGNQCNAEGYDETCVTSNAQCAKWDTTLYNLKCESQTLLTNTALTCPGGYFMTSCSGLTREQVASLDNSTPLDNSYVGPGNQCLAQQDNRRPLYTSMVCCILTSKAGVAAKLYQNIVHDNTQPIIGIKNSTIVAIFMVVITILLTLIGVLLCYKSGKFEIKKGYNFVYNFSDSTDNE